MTSAALVCGACLGDSSRIASGVRCCSLFYLRSPPLDRVSKLAFSGRSMSESLKITPSSAATLDRTAPIPAESF
ncbi:hypothetical protein FKP32DRAFT_1596739 [Trametes sanguinea]|nr:hypothetical protein FKP32DRAFT_1596739 [Trametes sanguinea]